MEVHSALAVRHLVAPFFAPWLCFSRIELGSFDIQQGCCRNLVAKLALTGLRCGVKNMTVVPIQAE